MKILITGANGFLGASLAQRLAGSDHQVMALVRRPGENPSLRFPNITEVKGDVRDKDSLDAAMKGVQQVYHLAALSTDWAADLREFYEINILGTVNVLAAACAAGVGRIVNTSSAGVIGPPDPDNIHPVNEKHIRTVGFFIDYEASKAIADTQVLRCVLQGMNIVTVNPTRIYGPGPMERKNGYLLLINSYLKRRITFFPGFIKPIANFVHVDDVVNGLLLAMDKGVSGESYLIGGSNVTFPQLFETLEKITGKKSFTVPIPIWIMSLAARLANLISKFTKKPPLLTRTWLRKAGFSWPVSSEKAKHDLGYVPMEYETAIRHTVEWLEEETRQGRIK